MLLEALHCLPEETVVDIIRVTGVRPRDPFVPTKKEPAFVLEGKSLAPKKQGSGNRSKPWNKETSAKFVGPTLRFTLGIPCRDWNSSVVRDKQDSYRCRRPIEPSLSPSTPQIPSYCCVMDGLADNLVDFFTHVNVPFLCATWGLFSINS